MTSEDYRDSSGHTRSGSRAAGGPRQRSAQAPSERARGADPARAAAYETLRAVQRGAYANLTLPGLLRERRITGRDAALATELTHGTLRGQRFYDAVLQACLDRPLDEVDKAIQAALRMGVHQLLSTRIPAHAAVTETVGLTRAAVGAGPSQLVNAVLRRVSERSREEWLAEVTAGLDPMTVRAVTHSHPDWVARALRQALLGHAAATPETVDAELDKLMASHNVPAQVHLVARPGVAQVEDLYDAGGQALEYSPIGAILPHGDPGGVPGVRDGRFAVQDEGSQLVALTLAAAPVTAVVPERWLDLCAGPGGKTAVLAGEALLRGIPVVANELAPHRAELVDLTTRALVDAGADLQVRTGDGRSLPEEDRGAYTRVLVDAPCTGLGSLRRRPEARWRHAPEDLATLSPLQRGLLESAAEAVAPGGVIAYSTCSPHLAETTMVVQDFLKRHPELSLLDAAEVMRSVSSDELEVTGPLVQLWPHRHGTDGMFLALLRREES